MTAAEWESCADPTLMLQSVRGGISDRQIRLFLVACCRGIFHIIEDKRARWMVEVGERIAEGQATPAEIAEVVGNYFAMYGEYHAEFRVAVATCSPELSETVKAVLDDMVEAVCEGTVGNNDEIAAAERARQCRLLREVIGNPFAPEDGAAGR